MALQHTRSRSFPSQPAIIQVDESLLSETTPSSLASLTNRIKGLQNLHERVDDLLQQPCIQRVIRYEVPQKRVNEITDNYIMLLDACTAAKDLISVAKRDIQELLSGVRRRMPSDAAHSYLTSRRNLKKMAQKATKKQNLRKGKGNGNETSSSPVENLLMDAKSSTLAMLVSLFSYTTGSNKSLMSKLSKKVEEETEFTKVDDALASIMQNEDDVKVDDLLLHLREMESSIQILEDGLECLFRCLIKTRVLLLNILSH